MAVMDEVEAVIFLTSHHAQALLGLSSGVKSDKKKSNSNNASRGGSEHNNHNHSHVLLLGGEKGVIRIYKVVLEGKIASSFQCIPLATIGVNEMGTRVIGSSSSSFDSSSVGTETSITMQSINTIHYLPSKGELLVSTKDAHFFGFKLQGESIVPNRQYVGSHDDVLDMSYLPEHRSPMLGVVKPKLAVATNSSVVRIMSCGSGECRLLHGHTDIVLALDTSPDG